MYDSRPGHLVPEEIRIPDAKSRCNWERHAHQSSPGDILKS
ncbi:hypothetical protein OOU_Y34scaffold00247g20 [Pyricularia oryzae Y34]|uniref:Uncharacterized protein n=3 Tax=Pyricularia oryzae TaxID=318829 RepID=A0A4P7NHA2_PYROR|nr:hypothetical protein OOU_Y34scaffold00247g20 [Pyricularia oryzae Y34]QBZ61359.1 hypothetical protein PoMZ_08308 [Pyricularia oryzae]